MASIFNQEKRLVIFVKDVNGLSTVVGTKRVKAESEFIIFKKHSYPIDTKIPVYRHKRKIWYMIDLISGQQTIYKKTAKIPKDLTDATFKNEIARQLVSTLMKVNPFDNYILALALLFGGLMAGIIIGQFIDFSGTGG